MKNYEIIPFNLERAKRIHSGREQGFFVTKKGIKVEIISFNNNDPNFAIAAIYKNKNYNDIVYYTSIGTRLKNGYTDSDLFIAIPLWQKQCKDGDILIDKSGIVFILKEFIDDKYRFYAALTPYNQLILAEENLTEDSFFGYKNNIIGFANKRLRKMIICALQASSNPKAKDCLINLIAKTNTQYFFFKQTVLVRNDLSEIWTPAEFGFIDEDGKYTVFGGTKYKMCIAYNESTKHLMGTVNNYNI